MAGNQDDIVIGVSLDTKTIKTGVNRVVGDIDYITQAASRSFDALGKRIDKAIPTSVQSRIQNMVGIGTKSTKEWTGALAQQGAELEKLRARYNPVFAAVKQYQSSVVSIQQAHRLGAISAEEMTAAIQRERKATLDSIAAIKQRNGAIASMRPAKSGPGSFQTANIAAQFQDIAVTSAMGMSPIQIALQQGTQLSAVFNEMGKGKAVIQGIGAAFASIVSPVSLVTIGVIAAGAALTQYIMSGSKTKDLTEVFKAHAESIALVKSAYGDLGSFIQAIRPEDAASQILALKDQLQDFYKVVGDEANRKSSFGTALLTDLAPLFKEAPQAAKTLSDAFINLNKSIRSGTPDLLSFREAMSKIANDASVPKAIRDEAQALAELKDEVLQAARAIPSVNSALSLMGSIAADQVGKINAVKKALEELSNIAVPALGDSERAYKAYDEAIKGDGSMENRIRAAEALQKALGRIKAGQMPVPGEKPNRESIAPEKTRKSSDERKAERQAERDANAYRDLVKSAQDRIDQLQLEEQLVGKTGVAAETMRMKLELLQRAQDKGRNVSVAQRAEIEKLAEAYGKAAEKVAAMSLAEELQFERAQMFRSPTEQRVYSQLRSAGISPDSEYGQAIGNQIRLNEQLAEGKDLATDFAQGLASDLLNGVSAMDALANAAKNLGAKLIEIGTNQVINSLFSSLAGGLGGGAGFGTNYFPPAPSMGGFMFSSGGYTGVGGKYQPAGIVHKGEYVVPKNIVDRIGAGNIERLMAGFADGGLVGGPRVPSMPAAANNNSSSFTFAPVIDARGADVAAVARLEQVVAKQQAEFSGRVVQSMRQAKSTRNWRG